MFSSTPDKFRDDDREFEEILRQYSENARQDRYKRVNFDDFSYQLGTQKEALNSSKYGTFLSDLANGSYLKSKNRSAEKSQIYEGYMTTQVSGRESQLSYSEVYAVQNISGTFEVNRNDRGPQLKDVRLKFLEDSDYCNVSRSERKLYQELIHRNICAQSLQQYLLNEGTPNFNTGEKLSRRSTPYNIVDDFEFKPLSPKANASIDKYITNCYDCIKKISEGFDDILYYNNGFSERYPYDFVRNNKSSLKKKTRFEDSEKKSDKSDSTNSMSITGHFLNTSHVNNGSQNRVIFKNNSENLSRNFSSEDIDDYSYYLRTDRYCSLRNLYSSSDYSKDKSGNRKHKKQHQQQQQQSMVSPVLDFLRNPVIREEEYREWLKQNNLLKYASCSITNSSTIGQPTENLLDYSTLSTDVPLKYNSLLSMDDYFFRCSSEENVKDQKFMEIHCYDLYEMIIYEHLVVINFLTFFTSYFNVRRIKKLSLNDHLLQIIFFAICYGIFMFVKNSEMTVIIN